jgi:acyl-CoA thioesterase-1
MMQSLHPIQRLARNLFLIAGIINIAWANTTVPDVGSIWESSLEYDSLPTDNGTATIRRAKEVSRVVRLMEGRPVFAGAVFGYQGEIIESTQGTVVYTDDCKDKVPPEMLIAPKEANQCVWHVCHPPALGKSFTRPMIFFVKLFSCTRQVATYSFVPLRIEEFEGNKVTVGNAKVFFSAFRQTAWQSYVQDGVGEVHSEAPGRRTTYTRVDVSTVNYKSPVFAPENKTALPVVQLDDLPTSCELVAFGDSLTEGMGASREDAYPAQLSNHFGKTVCNLGISGNTTEVAKQRVASVIALKPTVVIISLGFNDAFQGMDPAVTANNLTSILLEFRRANILVVLLGLEGVARVLPPTVEPLLRAFRNLERQEGVLQLPDAFVGVLDHKANLSSDGIHPNANGYKRLCENIMEQAFSMLRVIPSLITLPKIVDRNSP